MATKQQNNSIAYAMIPFKLLTWPIGVWPLQVFNHFSLIRWIVATCCLSIIVILPIIEFRLGCTDAEKNVDSVMMISCGLLAMLKTIWFRVYADNLAHNHNSAINDYLTIESAEKYVIMRRHAFVGRMLACFMICFSYVSSAVFTLVSVLTDEGTAPSNVTTEEAMEDYPIPSRCTLEYLDMPSSMSKIVRFFEFIVLVLTSTSNHGTDALFLNITLHVCGQMKILKDDFSNFNVSKPKVRSRFIALIDRHTHLITMASELAETISFVLLMQFFVSSMLLCIVGFQFILALKTHNIGMLAKSAMILCAFLSQLTAYSVVGDYFKSQMEEVGQSIYRSDWYDLPAIVTRNLVFIMMWDQLPIKFQAGNFIVVNLSTYMSILKTSVSYLSVLRVMVDA